MTAGVAFAPATHARPIGATRLLIVSVARHHFAEGSFAELPRLLSKGDVVVVNDAATLPASVVGHTVRGAPIELRLLALPNAERECDAVIFGAGDWHTPTERRSPPPSLSAGDALVFGSLEATVVLVQPAHRVHLRFERSRDETVAALYRQGRPV